jgi:hypothetical protein
LTIDDVAKLQLRDAFVMSQPVRGQSNICPTDDP